MGLPVALDNHCRYDGKRATATLHAWAKGMGGRAPWVGGSSPPPPPAPSVVLSF